MPDKPLTVITYAASASLAAAALVYFFTPNYLLDGRTSTNTAKMRRKGVVGLANPANDCFINSILQALAGLRELRLYLIRELHRRTLDDGEVYKVLPEKDKDGKSVNTRKMLSLQKGEVTQGLKDILDRLNERPLQKKTISASGFVLVLEKAFGTRISKAQQDAQEFLQVVAERVSDEYHAGKEARKRAKEKMRSDSAPAIALPSITFARSPTSLGPPHEQGQEPERSTSLNEVAILATKAAEEEEVGFPLEGRTESQIECLHCHFIPKSTPISFVMLTLPVPQKNHVTLDDCFDSYLKREYIDDYKCDRCRLQHAIETYQKELKRAKSEKEQHSFQTKIEKLQTAVETDPERPPPDVELPNSKLAPMRRIERSVRIVDFPQVLVVHLSRSIFDSHSSTKNMAKVSFREKLALGGLQHRRNYRLLGVVCHKGQHHSGHYETFRRQLVHPPVSHPHPRLDTENGPYSRGQTPVPSTTSSPLIRPWNSPDTRSSSAGVERKSSTEADGSGSGNHASIVTLGSMPSSTLHDSSSPSPISTQPSLHSLVAGPASSKPAPPQLTTTPAPAQPNGAGEASATPPSSRPGSSSRKTKAPSPPLRRSSRLSAREAHNKATASASKKSAAQLRVSDSVSTRSRSLSLVAGARSLKGSRAMRRPPDERWWRMSDEKIKECKTSDVLGMQKEVYLLFYEMERE